MHHIPGVCNSCQHRPWTTVSDPTVCRGLCPHSTGLPEQVGFPQCGGAIDGTHIPIIAPKDKRNDYYNRKGWYSMVMQAVCDHRYRFYDIECGWPGKVHDARVLRNSKIFEDGEAGRLFPNRPERIGTVDVNICLIGDPAYPLLSWIMKAYPVHVVTTPAQRHFNYRLSRARMCIENAFGRLKGRWRCLRTAMENDTAVVPTIVSACCILHNICEATDEDYDMVLNEADANEQQQPARVNASSCNVSASAQRNAVCAHLS